MHTNTAQRNLVKLKLKAKRIQKRITQLVLISRTENKRFGKAMIFASVSIRTQDLFNKQIIKLQRNQHRTERGEKFFN